MLLAVMLLYVGAVLVVNGVWLIGGSGAESSALYIQGREVSVLNVFTGFVGIVVPHAVRLLLGGSHRVLLPVSMLLGAAFLVAADVLARTVLSPSELPIGVVTALVGAPFFVALVRRQRAAAL